MSKNYKQLKCKKCKYEWIYKGNKKVYATCPDCKTSTKINGDEVK